MSQLTPEEKEQLEAVSRRFNDWFNAEVRAGNMTVGIMLELVGNIYVRLRAIVELHELLNLLEIAVNTVEGKIREGKLDIELADGTPVPFLSKEQQSDRPGLIEMIRDADHQLTDEELERFLADSE